MMTRFFDNFGFEQEIHSSSCSWSTWHFNLLICLSTCNTLDIQACHPPVIPNVRISVWKPKSLPQEALEVHSYLLRRCLDVYRDNRTIIFCLPKRSRCWFLFTPKDLKSTSTGGRKWNTTVLQVICQSPKQNEKRDTVVFGLELTDKVFWKRRLKGCSIPFQGGQVMCILLACVFSTETHLYTKKVQLF